VLRRIFLTAIRQSREATTTLIETVVTCAAVTENEPLRRKVLSQTGQIVSDFTCILSNLHDRVVQGMHLLPGVQ